MNSQASQSNIETEFLDIDSKRAWGLIYQRIRNECLNYDYTFGEARKSQNKNLNRYRDVSPYDHSRIVLSKGNCDYINANLVTMEKAHRRYILTQGPLPHTTEHFWLMVWEQNCKAVLMLNRIIEKNQVKCHQYWPLRSDDVLDLTDVGLKVQFVSESEASYYTTRMLRLTEVESGSSREIIHFHYTTWPDFGVPENPTAFLNFLMVVRDSGALDQNVGPPVVHCSAGIGRSGTFCLVDSCLVLIEENGLDSVNVQELLLEMRRFRMGLIQTPDQLRFSYLAILEGAKGKSILTDSRITSNHTCLDNKAYVRASNDGKEDEDEDDDDEDDDDDDDDDEDDDDEPPPLPPPRGESLGRCSNKETTVNCVNQATNEYQPPNKPLPNEPQSLQPNRPLPCVPVSSGEESPTSPGDNTQNNRNDSLRHRIRAERTERITQQVREIKRKQQAAESWQQMKRSLLQPFAIGIGVGVLLLGGALAYSYYTSRV